MNFRITAALLLAAFTAPATLAAPARVRTKGAKSQSVQMCPDCKKKITCAVSGDYLIGLSVDTGNAKIPTGTFVVHLLDKAKKPVTDADVSIKLDMPKHKHSIKPLAAKHASHGQYVATTTLGMSGAWTAVVSAEIGGDTVKQTFTFSK